MFFAPTPSEADNTTTVAPAARQPPPLPRERHDNADTGGTGHSGPPFAAADATTAWKEPPLALPAVSSSPVQAFFGYVEKFLDLKVVVHLWDEEGSEMQRMFDRKVVEHWGVHSEGQPVYLAVETAANGDLRMMLRALGPPQGTNRQKLVDMDYSEFQDFNE